MKDNLLIKEEMPAKRKSKFHQKIEEPSHFGYFDDSQKEFVIIRPDTPFPWINYLGQDDFFSIISNTCGGYAFYKDAKLRRLTRYRYNNAPLDNEGRYYYIYDNGTVWNPGWKPVKTTLSSYECRHGLGYTQIKSAYNNIEAELLCFVPLGFQGEVHRMKLTNQDVRVKHIRLYSFLEWCLWNALEDSSNFQRSLSTGEVEVENSVIYHKSGYRERRNHYAFFSVNHPLTGFDTDRDVFLGQYNGYDAPQSVMNNRPGNSIVHGWSPVASHCIDVYLAPGETKELIFILGYVENKFENKFIKPGVINKDKAYSMIEQFSTPARVKKAVNSLHEYWDQMLSGFQVKSSDKIFNRVINCWNQYQCMITYRFSRSASYFESGIGRGIGFRDSNQDIVGFVHMEPEKARERIIDLACTQMADGSAYHQYQPLTKKGNSDIGNNFNDDPLWLIFSTTAYIKETGDLSILDEKVPFDHDESNAQSLFEHLRRSFNLVVENTGKHGLPLIGRADWNDCLNLNCFSINPDESFQTAGNINGRNAESVMIAGMAVLYGKEFAELCRKYGVKDEADRVQSITDQMTDVILRHGWDGEWFLRAYDHFGKKVGSKENDEGKIFIEPQGFSIMAGIGLDDGKALSSLEAVKKHLVCEHGIVLTNPAFSWYNLNMGEITSYPPGYKENAGIFCHNNPWIIIAETMIGRGKEAFDYFQKITPAYRSHQQELHKTEPYVYSQMIAGKDAPLPGEAKNSWLTGTAAWNFYAVTQYILGIRTSYDGMIIDPCIPCDWTYFSVYRIFRGAKYTIQVNNPDRISRGIKRITVDGKLIQGNLVPVFEKDSEHEVVVEMG